MCKALRFIGAAAGKSQLSADGGQASDLEPLLFQETDLAPMSAKVRESVVAFTVGNQSLFSSTISHFEKVRQSSITDGRKADTLAADVSLRQLRLFDDVANGRKVILQLHSGLLLQLNRNGLLSVDQPLESYGLELSALGWCSSKSQGLFIKPLTEERWKAGEFKPNTNPEWIGTLLTSQGTMILRGLKTFPPGGLSESVPSPRLTQDEAKEAVHPLDAAQMIYIPAGPFLFGEFGYPIVGKTTQAYWIDKYEVTNERYSGFVKATGYQPPNHWAGGHPPEGLLQHPVVNVTFDDAVAYCKWAGKRLPSVEEWEKAARGATDGRLYPWGDALPPDSIDDFGQFRSGTAPVGMHPKGVSPFGLQDMIGNVDEWTATPLIAGIPDAIVTRGGSWKEEKPIPISRALTKIGGIPAAFAESAGQPGKGKGNQEVIGMPAGFAKSVVSPSIGFRTATDRL